jgi:hypothetical protein
MKHHTTYIYPAILKITPRILSLLSDGHLIMLTDLARIGQARHMIDYHDHI